MTYKLYCDRCDKEIAGWDNEYGQVMSVTIGVKSSDRGCVLPTKEGSPCESA